MLNITFYGFIAFLFDVFLDRIFAPLVKLFLEFFFYSKNLRLKLINIKQDKLSDHFKQ